MIPLKDDAPRVGTPSVTYFLIFVNTLMFLMELWIGHGNPRQFDLFLQQFGVVPARFPVVLLNQGYVPWDLVYQLGTRFVTPAAAFVPVFTSMFLHGSWAHLIFNMLSLWIFGDNVEDYLGHFRYLVLYLVSGVAAMAVHTVFNLNSTVPTVGASGAIAGVLGAYFVLYPRAKILTILPIIVLMYFVEIPAVLYLLLWFAAQLYAGLATGEAAGGVAWWAHVGGFLFGMA